MYRRVNRLLLQPSGAAVPVLTLAEAKSHCRIQHDDEDDRVAAALNGAIAGARAYMGRALGLQTFVGTIDHGFGCGAIEIPIPPTRSIESVEYVDEDGDTQTLAPGGYALVNRGDQPSLLAPAYGATWPTMRCQPDAFSVSLTAGYDDDYPLPDSIRSGILLLVGHLFENREAVNVGNIVTQMPLAVEWLLGPHRVLRV